MIWEEALVELRKRYKKIRKPTRVMLEKAIAPVFHARAVPGWAYLPKGDCVVLDPKYVAPDWVRLAGRVRV